jgi:hypothetical protein
MQELLDNSMVNVLNELTVDIFKKHVVGFARRWVVVVVRNNMLKPLERQRDYNRE